MNKFGVEAPNKLQKRFIVNLSIFDFLALPWETLLLEHVIRDIALTRDFLLDFLFLRNLELRPMTWQHILLTFLRLT